MKTKTTIVFYDANCSICRKSVLFAEKRKRTDNLEFVPLQSEVFEKFRRQNLLPESLHSVVLYEKEKTFIHSTAALKVFKFLRPPWNWITIFLLCPKFVRDAVYQFIVHKRYLLDCDHNECFSSRRETPC